ncbi:amino acid adenylation domain-containing protein [Methylobacterium nonmethylotrophicum]|uniref:Non-ribosomal peptide synthetase n=1 Tax=Methylobacterium nonmethylotrophicum TaxID=1141884 RepID=A0A4Z0NVZ5_9HYPH|nr:non-ribosomal peptide synthetase [Methylobacterium nonmethylotrophicum]TGE01252.1 non-ribosomal peptide synthetase [Methylobacterium nonmethylotrophicum]
MAVNEAGLRTVGPAIASGPERLALTDAQRAVWLDMKRLDDPRVYQVGTAITVRGEIDPGLARQAVRVVVGRHDALRLRVDSDEPVQWLARESGLPFRHHDLSAEADPARAFAEHVRRVQAEGFALGDAPLFKVEVVRLGPSDWRIVLICHHLICDGMSIALLQRYILQAYLVLSGEAASDEEESGLGAVVLPRSSFLAVIREAAAYAASPRAAEDLRYWRDRLTPLPALVFEDRPRPDGSEAAPAPLALDRAGFAAFAQAAKGSQATLHRAIVALLAITLGRRYGRADFALGMALHGREGGSRGVVGMLAGLIPVRCRPDLGASLRANVERLAAALDLDLRHAKTSVDALGRELGLGAQGRHALFDAVVTIMPPMGEPAPTTSSEPLRTVEITPLALYVRELGGEAGLEIEFSYDRTVLGGAEVARLRAVLADVIAAFCTRPETRLSAIPGLARPERERIAGLAEGGSLPVPAASLADLVERRAAAAPDAPAVVSDETTLSAAQLDRAAARIAARLIALGLTPGDVVGVAMARAALSVPAILGILKAGCVYLPLDPAYPEARLALMVEDAGARLVLVRDAAGAPDLAGRGTLALEESWVLHGEEAPANLPEVGPDSLAYIVYTSGSTGRPKGVAVSHAAAVNLAVARLRHDPIGAGDRVLAAISIGFDVSIGQLLLPLLSGATVVVSGDVRGQSPQAFWEFLVRHRVSHVNSVPSFFDAMLPGAPAQHALKQLMLGGEPLSGALAARLKARLGPVRIVNMYGPTEACIDASAYPVPESGTEDWPTLPIGRPLPNYAFHILNERFEEVGIGAAGELFIGGAGLAAGYVGQPDLTRERFVAHPRHGRLYRTGDLAAWREDGTVAFLGRADNQVKVRGHRIELGEIEGALASHPGVARSAVVARPGAGGERCLVAYVVPQAGHAPTAEDIDAHLARVLPAHMVPAFYRFIDAIPLTHNGKIDHRALPEPVGPEGRAGTPPASPTERWLAGHFADLLGARDACREDSFFALGGHSLLATRLAARVREAFAVELPLRTLFEAPRLGDLAGRIDALRAGAGRAAAPLAASPRPARVPLSYPQERIWFVDRLQQDTSYNIAITLELEGALDRQAVARALEAIVLRHEALRTRIVVADGEPVQVVEPLDGLPLTVIEAEEADLPALLARLVAHRFDLETELPFRFRLVAVAGDVEDRQRHVLSLLIHHVAFDGWSAGVFHREFVALYGAFAAGLPDPLPPLPLHYADFALWQRAQDREADLRYWLEELKDAPPRSELPGREPLAGAFARVPGRVAVDLGAALSRDLQRLSQENGASVFMVLHAAFALLMGRWNGQDDIVIGTVAANRGHAAFEGMLGCFVNTLPLRTRLRRGESFRALLARVADADLSAFAHQDLPFEQLFSALGLDRRAGHRPVFQTMFILQNTPPVSMEGSGLAVRALEVGSTDAKFDLLLTLAEGRDGIAGAFDFAADRFDPAMVARFAGQFRRLLAAVAADPDRDLASLDLLSEEERATILEVWNRPPVAFPGGTLDGLFESQARATPAAVAVIDRDGSEIAYGDLDARATRLARHLAARGVGPERVVGVRMERSAATIVAMLAILKAGGAYLPLDPAYPAERLDAMAADAGAVLVLDAIEGLSGTAELQPCGDADRLAYVIFTSGTTGRPKGVAMPHRAAVNLLHARSASYDPLGPGDRVLAATSVSFDMSIEQMLFPLLRGATVVVADDVRRLGADGFWSLVSLRKVTHIDFVPSFLDAVLPEARGAGPLALKRLMLGGEAVPGAFLARIHRTLPGLEVVNVYGPTETCIDATYHVATPADVAAGILPIGRPLPNYTATILDPDRNLVAPGVEGDLYIGGAGLARGYVNAPALTAERFVDSVAGRLYRTGDRARWREDGTIAFLGRKDDQIKIRGFRVELGEIAAALMEHPDIRKAVVVPRTSLGQMRLVAFVVGTCPPEALKAHAKRRLPDHMVPSAFVPIAAVPLTGSGKVDVAALPPDLDEGEPRPHHPPEGPDEEALQGIWQTVLGLTIVGRDESFFDLGGQSLTAIRLIHEIGRHFGVTLPMRTLFEDPTIAGLAAALRRGRDGEAGGILVPLRAGSDRPPLFCIHPGGGHVFCYLPLVRALGAGQPVYGIQARGIEAAEALPSSIEAMAADYVRAIAAVRPDGPVQLLGMSLGGLIAFEVARQLREAGREVAFLAMLDTAIPEDIVSDMSGTQLARTLAAEFGLADLVDDDTTGVQGVIDRASAAGRLPPGFKLDRAERIAVLFANMAALQKRYRPRAIDVRTLSVRALDRPAGDRPPDWSRYVAADLVTLDLACAHNDLISERLAPALASAMLLHGTGAVDGGAG